MSPQEFQIIMAQVALTKVIAAKLSDANSRFYTAYFNATDCALEMMANIEFLDLMMITGVML